MSTEGRALGSLVETRGLSVRFGVRTVLESIDVAVAPGRIVTLIGPNGAGKTTLVKAVLGLIAPTAGTVWQRPGLRIGYMPQRLHIDRTLPLTVRRFLALWGPAGRAETDRVLDEVGARHVADGSIHGLSGGEMQRVLLARALLRMPDLLVLDEPIQGVDVIGQTDLFQLIARIRNERQCGVLLVSHDLHLVMAQTDEVVCLNQHVCCSGHPEAVSRHPAFIELFGPRAAALAVYQHHHDHRHDVAGDVVALPERPGAAPRRDERHSHG